MTIKTHNEKLENFDRAIAGALTILNKITSQMPCSDGSKEGQARFPKYWKARAMQSALVNIRQQITDIEGTDSGEIDYSKFSRKICETENDMFRAWYMTDSAKEKSMSDRPWLNVPLGKKREKIFADMIEKGEARRTVPGEGTFYFE